MLMRFKRANSLGYRLYRSLFYFEGRGFLQNPVTVPLDRLTFRTESGASYAYILLDGQKSPVRVQFVVPAMICESNLVRMLPAPRSCKQIAAHPPPITVDHAQAALAIALDLWDDKEVNSHFNQPSTEFVTRRE